jgi:antitoxin component YwqK of YwqJK toxin-antitoxin module
VGQELLDQHRWPDGTLKATRYSDGVRIHFITFHENGQVKEVGCYKQGKRDGVWKQYSDTGALLAQAGFRNGQRQGVWEFRTGDDKPMGRLTYTSGVLATGEQYDVDGALVAHRSY